MTAEPVSLLLVRHAEQERIGADGELTARGAAQSARLADVLRLAPADRLVSSTRVRAIETARALGREPEPRPEFDEFDRGPDHGGDRDRASEFWRPEDTGGESLRTFQARVEAGLLDLVTQNHYLRTVLVTHAGVIDATLRWVYGAGPGTPWSADTSTGYVSITELVHWPVGRHPSGAPRHTTVVRVGDLSHLPEDLRSGR